MSTKFSKLRALAKKRRDSRKGKGKKSGPFANINLPNPKMILIIICTLLTSLGLGKCCLEPKSPNGGGCPKAPAPQPNPVPTPPPAPQKPSSECPSTKTKPCLELVEHSKTVPLISMPYLSKDMLCRVNDWTVRLSDPTPGYVVYGDDASGNLAVWQNFDIERKLTSQWIVTQAAENNACLAVQQLDSSGSPQGRTVYQYKIVGSTKLLIGADHFSACGRLTASVVVQRNENGSLRTVDFVSYDDQGKLVQQQSALTMPDATMLNKTFDLWYYFGQF